MFVDNRLLARIAEALESSARSLSGIELHLRPRLSATLTIKQGGKSVATLLVGKTAQAMWQEFSGPNGTGDKLPPAGQVTFTSSDPAVATVDPNSGLITAVALGSVTISGVDAANSLTASDSLTDTEVAQSATLTIVPNP